jgi:hypothetical protein
VRAHVAACAVCADVAVGAHAMQAERDRAWGDVQVPPAGRVWWRAELRARQEAALKASQPITIVQGLAGACVAGLVVALIEIAWLQFSRSVDVIEAVKHFMGLGQLDATPFTMSMPQLAWQLGLAIAAWVILTPIALYLVLSDKPEL